MKRVLLWLVLVTAGSAFASDVRVRLWTEHPPLKVQITSGTDATIRACAGCSPKQFGVASIEARGSKISVAGKPWARVLLAGAYEVTNDKTSVRLSWPAEVRSENGRLSIVVAVPLEEYVAGVLAGEASGMKSAESLKAMAVAARTYAMKFKGRHTAEGFDVCDTTHCQDLRLSAVTDRMREAALATEGELAWYRGEKAATYYSRSCGGTLEDGRTLMSSHAAALPYLASRQDAYCTRKNSDTWRNEIRKQDLGRALDGQGIRVGEVRRVEVVSRTDGGRVRLLRVGGVELTAEKFRLAVGRALGWQWIRSDSYEVMDRGDSVMFAGRGQGHGVGMCQAGAAVMGEEGAGYREILAYYYPGTKIGVSAQGISWTVLADEQLELRTVRPDVDRLALTTATKMLRGSEAAAGWKLERRPQVTVYPTMEMYRDATGEPGWVAASTRGRVVRLQPTEVLRGAGVLESTLRHEFAHMLVEQKARPGLPLWFREGLVLCLSDARAPEIRPKLSTRELERRLTSHGSQRALREAYRESGARVAELIRQRGKPTVLAWLERGLPPDVQ